MGRSTAGRSLAPDSPHRRWRPWSTPAILSCRRSPPLPGGRARAVSYARASPAVRARLAGKAVECPVRIVALFEQADGTGICPTAGPVAGESRGTDRWLAGTPIADLARLAKVRGRIEHDYRELKHGLGLDHFEGRSWLGWYHQVTFVTAAHAFLTGQRLALKVSGARLTPYQTRDAPPRHLEVLDRYLYHLPPATA